MPLIRDIAQADYSVVEELLYSNHLGHGRFYDPEGMDVVVAELRGSVVGSLSSSSTATSGTTKAGRRIPASRRSS